MNVHVWNDALELIEANLTEELNMADVARVAMTSEYHFRRMFSTLSGMPVSEYIRRRRRPANPMPAWRPSLVSHFISE